MSVFEETNSSSEVIKVCLVGFSSLLAGVGVVVPEPESEAKEDGLVGEREEGRLAEGGRRTKESAGVRRKGLLGDR